ncbi:MAG TPA: stage III sporulation protein AE [Firmicutes bacterium]|uniref:Stage III sporulation protein AE n=1 Tax=Capillibacterium thermochitinicola TaxID=2699427 RepID=A0A8J6I270_9FIRM|nr:stage III sporulation protein AE [Capillibacterium thermochitinicola]MBA2132907.1 stage III sporulation protein AE [Capillibacterium thermochitinicola]HHW11784.1 stage III sporulation protein AE [Bacillota bacterium]
MRRKSGGRRWWAGWFAALLLVAIPVQGQEIDPLGPILDQEIAALDLEAISSFLAQLDGETRALLPQWDLRGWVRGGMKLDLAELLKKLTTFLGREVVVNLHLLGRLILLAVIGGVLVHFQQAWAGESLGNLVANIIYLVLMGLAIQSFTATMQLAYGALERVNSFVLAILPTIFTLLAAAGGITLTTVCHPVVWGGTGIVLSLVRNLVLPLILLAGTVGLVSRLVEGFSVTKLAGVARQGAVLLLTFLVTIFLGVISLQGVTVAAADGLGLTAAKFLTGNLVPIVGGVVSDSLELAAGCSLLIKNALGAFAALGVVLLCAYPALKILVVAFIYRLAAAFVQPLGQDRLAESLQEIGQTVMVIFATVTVVGLMFFFCLTILIGLGNLTAVVR